nr:NFACT family protein [Chitinophagaceae bacterium]
PEKPPMFCMLLRKYLSQARLKKIQQIKSERIVELRFETIDEEYSLVIELFANGNIILVKDFDNDSFKSDFFDLFKKINWLEK